ncbi:hypothetical protein EJF18_50666 [Clavispora lusitaniae]|uniref:Uncharacterized protein n=1 Tax=Clavispora lusitaniae TaxID=36911 RepID=A0ACD0WPV3_CLALS|nr:hypothetical protein EJF14_50666 [Clavispora lusitaniae]QFZ35089.1 hypothetical protein EJF16_50666 [Clavispora lusitaniae]QFZ40774.1 hypothetical protein EJF15_50666 [Clavispora lusitaniae]QFZ46454.1 hypothetical protein EJF18_50666 [Clavispora lusitaniae]QFZ52116.1 hypothetical protein EJF17_50666 [Clavispora lusitaniae]
MGSGSLLRFSGGNGRNKRRVQASGQQHTVWNLGHQPFSHGHLQSLSHSFEVSMLLGNLAAVPPQRSEVAGNSVGVGVVDVARWEGEHLVTLVNETLQLGRKVSRFRRLGQLAHVQGDNTDGVTRSNDSVLLLVVQGKGEHAVQVFWRIEAVFFHQRNDGLAVGKRLVFVVAELGSQGNVVVDFSVDGQGVSLIGRNDGSGARVQADNGQSFVT